MFLGKISPEQFLKEYWQKKPLLIRGAFPELAQAEPLISPEELAGLACEEGVHARLVLEQGPDRPWQVLEGPFSPEGFAKLADSKLSPNWNLMVQEVENWVEQVAEIKKQFNFIPDWRVDDVMVSCAPDQGSVGAHTDHYDVFLLQGFGKRKWLIGNSPLVNPEIKSDIDLKILKTFTADTEYVLEAGDLLYLPPEFAHHGIAVGDSMTYSIGFRSPSKLEIFQSFLDHHQDDLEEKFYTDPDLSLQQNPAEISDASINKVSQLLKDLSDDPQSIRHWFGQLVSSNKRGESALPPEVPVKTFKGLLALMAKSERLVKNDQLRFAFSKGDDASESTLLFIDGCEFIVAGESSDFIAQLCQGEAFSSEQLLKVDNKLSIGSLLVKLYLDGYLHFAD